MSRNLSARHFVASAPDTPSVYSHDDVGADLCLRLIATSDLHASLLPYDYCANRPMAGQGLTGIARRIAEARAEVPNSLLFDNGDFLQGSPLADFAANPRRRRAHPVMTAFNALGYDAITLGNHEFNYGLEFLAATLSQARFPVVSANIATRFGKRPNRDLTLVPPYAILRRTFHDRKGQPHQLRIGVIGFAPPQIELWDRDHLDGRVQVRDIVTSAKDWLPRLRARGADVIVALAHSGIGALDPATRMENAATALAALPEVDAVIAGHSHLAFPGPSFAPAPGVDPALGLLAGKPAVMPGHSGSHLGIIDLRLTRSSGRRRWKVTAATAQLSSPQPGLPAPSLKQALAPDHRATLAWSRRILGHSRVALTTYFATTAPSSAIDLIAAAKADHTRRSLAGTQWEGLPLLASAVPFRSGGRGGAANFTAIPAGPFRMRNLSDLYSFPNTLVTLALTGAEIADWLEQSAAVFNQITPGASDAALHDDLVPSFSFEVIPGLSYAVDLSQPSRFDAHGHVVNPNARRIVGLARDGRPVDPGETLLLVTSSHRTNRAAAMAGPASTRVVLADGVFCQKVIANYFLRHGQVGEAPRQGWHFLPMPGTTVRITSGNGSERHLADIAHYRPEHLGQDAEGFAHYRLHL